MGEGRRLLDHGLQTLRLVETRWSVELETQKAHVGQPRGPIVSFEQPVSSDLPTAWYAGGHPHPRGGPQWWPPKGPLLREQGVLSPVQMHWGLWRKRPLLREGAPGPCYYSSTPPPGVPGGTEESSSVTQVELHSLRWHGESKGGKQHQAMGKSRPQRSTIPIAYLHNQSYYIDPNPSTVCFQRQYQGELCPSSHACSNSTILLEDSPDLQELLGVTLSVHGEVLSRLALLHEPGQRRTRDSRVALEKQQNAVRIFSHLECSSLGPPLNKIRYKLMATWTSMADTLDTLELLAESKTALSEAQAIGRRASGEDSTCQLFLGSTDACTKLTMDARRDLDDHTPTLHIGNKIRLHGLNNQAMNGRQGIVLGTVFGKSQILCALLYWPWRYAGKKIRASRGFLTLSTKKKPRFARFLFSTAHQKIENNQETSDNQTNVVDLTMCTLVTHTNTVRQTDR